MVTWLGGKDLSKIATSTNPVPVGLANDSGDINVQNPLPTDGDSVYAKDVDVDLSDIGGFSGAITDLFDDEHSIITNTSATNPKYIVVHLKRPIESGELYLTTDTGSFSNVKIIFRDAGGTIIDTFDDSSNNTTYTSRGYPISPIDFSEMRIEFHTANTITLGFILIHKNVHVTSALRALKPDGTSTYIDATAGGNLKVSLEEIETGVTISDAEYTYDAFGRKRVSDTGQRLDVEFLYDKQIDYFDEVTTNGTVTHNTNTRDLTLALADANDGSHATMISHPVPYTPGNSHLIDITGVLDLAGIGGGTAEVFLRSKISGSVVDLNTVEQSAWDNLTTGVDWTDSHILQIDFQSLKVGIIKFRLVANGVPTLLTTIRNDNLRNSGYWQLASLPAYWKLYTAGGITYMEMGYGNDDNGVGIRYRISANASATMKAICCTVKSEGGYNLQDLPGLARAIDNANTSVSANTSLIPILSIRTKSTFNSKDNLTVSLPKSFSITTDNPIRLALIWGCSLTGASWTDVDTNCSCMEYDVSASAFSGGCKIFSDYVATSRNVETAKEGLLGKTVMWNRQGTETGILTIAAIKTGVSAGNCLASIRWDELR